VLVLDFVHMPDFRTVIDGVSGPHPGLNGNHARLLQEQAKNAPLLQKRTKTGTDHGFFLITESFSPIHESRSESCAELLSMERV
jgi:hypothetical protein